MKHLPARVPDSGDPVIARARPPRVEEKSVDIGAVWGVIKNGKWLILSVLFVSTAFAVLFSALSEPTYEASSIVSLNTRGTGIPGTEVASSNPVVSDEIGLLQRSGDLAVRVAESLVNTAGSLGTTAFYPLLEGRQNTTENIANDISGQLWRRMSYRDLGSGMISITAQSSSRHEATHLANLFASEYQLLSKERSRANIVAAREFLESQIEDRAQVLDSINLDYARLVQKNDVVLQGSGGELARDNYRGLTDRLAEAESIIRQSELERGQLLRALNDAQENINTGSSGALQIQIQTLDTEIAQLEAALATAYRNNPDLIGNEQSVDYVAVVFNNLAAAKTSRTNLNSRLLREGTSSGGLGNQYAFDVRTRVTQLDLLIEERKAAVALYERQLNAIGRKLDAVPFQMFALDQIERKRTDARTWLSSLQQDLQGFRIAEQAELGYVTVTNKASMPDRPVKPDMRSNILLALLLGLAGGVGLAFVRTAVRTKLDSPDQIVGMGYPLLGSVPLMTKEIKATFKGRENVELNGKKRSTALVTLHSPWSPASEHYRLIRTNLQLGLSGKMPRVMMITSAEPGDGKSVTALNLAISIAHSGVKTLIIDADLRRPTIHRLLDAPVSPGLAEALSSNSSAIMDIEELSTDIENLYFLPSGRTLVPPPELLGSPRMSRLMDHLKHSFDTVIVDTPPVLAVTDPLILSPCCEAAVVVVSANKTTPKAINATISALENVRIPIAGVVFNRHNTDRNKTGYYDYSDNYSYAIDDE